ncbi:MAG: hypothetical protein OXK17_10180 [Thaumarchaeota archaeon]|nr:hypothetical protein [Nitrososphaerota archaeon]
MTRFEWFGGSVDLSALTDRIQQFFLDDTFHEIERYGNSGTPEWQDMLASKGGALRTISACRKSYHVSIRGHPANFAVSVDAGEWGENVAATLLTGGIGIAGLADNARFERRLWEHIRRSVEELGGSSTRAVLPGAAGDRPAIPHSLIIRNRRRVVQQVGEVHRCTGNYKKDGSRTAV